MIIKYYFDTCIWRDFYENRFGYSGRPLGSLANRLFLHVMKKKQILLFSDLVVSELKKDYSENDIVNMLNFLYISGILQKVNFSKKNYQEAYSISLKRKLATGDVLHAIIARNNNAIMVSQDKHFQNLKDIAIIKKPEQII